MKIASILTKVSVEIEAFFIINMEIFAIHVRVLHLCSIFGNISINKI